MLGVLIVTSDFTLRMVDPSTGQEIAKFDDEETKVTSAVFNEDGSSIVVGTLAHTKNLMVLDMHLKPVKAVTISFAENCNFDRFRVYGLSGYYHGNLLVHAVYYLNEGDFEDNYGSPLNVWLGANLTPQSDFQTLKAAGHARYFLQKELFHSNDDEPPVYKTEFLRSRDGKQIAGIFCSSQVTEMQTFSIKTALDGSDRLVQFYSFDDSNKYPKINANRPQGIMSRDCTTVFLGLKAIRYQIPGMPKTYQWDTEEEKEDDYPPMCIHLGVDGNLTPSLVLFKPLQQAHRVNVIPVPQGPPQAFNLPPNNPRLEESKSDPPFMMKPPPQQPILPPEIPVVELPKGPIRSVHSFMVEKLDANMIRAFNEGLVATQQEVVNDFPTVNDFERRL